MRRRRRRERGFRATDFISPSGSRRRNSPRGRIPGCHREGALLAESEVVSTLLPETLLSPNRVGPSDPTNAGRKLAGSQETFASSGDVCTKSFIRI